MLKTRKLSSLVLDFTLYPRHRVDETHIAQMIEAVRSGTTLPPIVCDAKTQRISDGFHRYEVARRLYGADADVNVDERDYPDDAAFFEDAIRLNSSHGNNLAPFDRARCIQRATELHIDPNRLASALQMTVEKIENLRLRKLALTDAGIVPIKGTIRHLAGSRLSKTQEAANNRAGGLSQIFYVNQVINLLEGDVLDPDNVNLLERLSVLAELLLPYVRADATHS